MRAAILLAAMSAAALPAAAHAENGGHPECSTILPPEQLAPWKRALAPEDLARLRDIGPDEPEYYADPSFTISPDGLSAAFQLRQGDPQRNVYCLAMVIVDLAHKSPPRIIDEGG